MEKTEGEVSASEMGRSALKGFFHPWHLQQEAAKVRAELDPEKEPEACALLDAIRDAARRLLLTRAEEIREKGLR